MKIGESFDYKIDVNELYKVDITLDKLFCMEYSDYIKDKAELCVRQMFDIAEISSSNKVIIDKNMYDQIIDLFVDTDSAHWIYNDCKSLQYIEYYVSNELKSWNGEDMLYMIKNAQRFTLHMCLQKLFSYINEIILKR